MNMYEFPETELPHVAHEVRVEILRNMSVNLVNKTLTFSAMLNTLCTESTPRCLALEMKCRFHCMLIMDSKSGL